MTYEKMADCPLLCSILWSRCTLPNCVLRKIWLSSPKHFLGAVMRYISHYGPQSDHRLCQRLSLWKPNMIDYGKIAGIGSTVSIWRLTSAHPDALRLAWYLLNSSIESLIWGHERLSSRSRFSSSSLDRSRMIAHSLGVGVPQGRVEVQGAKGGRQG